MSTLEEYKSQARIEMESGDYGAAIRSLTAAIDLETDNPTLYFTRGLAYFMRKDYDLAVEDLTAVLSVDHQNLDALLTRGNAYFQNNQLDEAYNDYSEFINIDEHHVDAPYERRAIILTRQGRIKDAIIEYSLAIDHQSKSNGKLYFNRALLQYSLANFNAAIHDTTHAIENSYPAPEVYELRGSALAQLEQWDQAIANYDTAISLDKRSASAYYNRGAVWYQMKRLDAAIRDFTSALKIEGDHVQTLYARALVYLDKEDYRNARRDLSAVLRVQPNNAAAYHKRGIVYSMLDKIDKSLDDFEKAVQISPTMPEYLICLGEIELEIGGFESAVGYFKRALLHQNDKDTLDFHRALAGLSLAYYLSKQQSNATIYYNQLVASDLDYGDIDNWRERFGWHNSLIASATDMIELIESQDE